MNWFWIPLAGIFAMDRRSAFNFMLSRPFVVSVIVGLAGNNLMWCMAGGVFFEIIGLMDLPVGTRISRDDTFGAFAYSMPVVAFKIHTFEAALIALLLSFIVMIPITLTVSVRRHANTKMLLAAKAMKQDNGRPWIEGNESWIILIGELTSFFRGMLIYSVGILIVVGLYKLVHPYVSYINVSPMAFIALCCLFSGYFSGFFDSERWTKALFLISGGLAAWLIF